MYGNNVETIVNPVLWKLKSSFLADRWICTHIGFNHQIKIEIIKTNESFKFMSYDCRNQFSLKPLHLYGELQFEVRNDFELSCFINCVLRFFFFLWDTFLTVELLFVRDLISGLSFDSIFLVFFDFSLFVFFCWNMWPGSFFLQLIYM